MTSHAKGIKCPCCDTRSNTVKDSRFDGKDNAVRRRRVCTKCGAKFTTWEGTLYELHPSGLRTANSVFNIAKKLADFSPANRAALVRIINQVSSAENKS